MIIAHDSLDEPIKDEQKNSSDDKIHPWRICPIGKHFVKKHIEHIPPSKQHLVRHSFSFSAEKFFLDYIF